MTRRPTDHPLDRLHARATRIPGIARFTGLTRVLLAIGFVPPGLKKVLGHRFANPEILTPATTIGGFFEAFFQAGEYYFFVGLAQVLAGLLLLVPATATLGALLYLPIIANIFVITWSMQFRGTWVITGLMLLANLYLLCWDWPRLRGIFLPPAASAPAGPASRSRWLEIPVWAGLAAIGWGALAAIGLGSTPRTLGAAGFALAAAGGAALGALTVWHAGRMAVPVAEAAPVAEEG
jgi:hypothetical protein